MNPEKMTVVIERRKEDKLKEKKVEFERRAIVGRDAEVNELYKYLHKLYNPYVALIGDEYVGKRSIILKYEECNKKEGIMLDGNMLNATLRNGAPFYELLKRITQKAKQDDTFLIVLNGEVITEQQIFNAFIDSGIPTVVLTKKDNVPPVFEKINVKPLDEPELYEIGHNVITELEGKYRVDFSNLKDEIIPLALVQKGTYGQPTAMIDMLEKVAIQASTTMPFEHQFAENFKSEKAQEYFASRVAEVNYEHIESVVVKEQNSAEIQGIYGQEDILQKVTNQLLKKELGFYDDKPLTMFFAGPTGVGKTETAKKISEVLQMDFLRVDMTTMNTEHSISRLIGSPPGYIGSQEGGLITNKLQNNSKVVILLDEVEKGHPAIMDTILIPMGEGKFQSGRGEEFNCKDAIIIFTSNIGAAEERSLGFDKVEKTLSERTTQSIMAQFRPEFIGRIDEICIFNELTEEAMKQIALDEIEKLSKKSNVTLPNVDEVIEAILQASNDKYGAREVKKKTREIAGDYILDAIKR